MDIIKAIHQRRTIRKFKNIPITSEQLKKYINAARVAPSAANLQPLKYAAVNSNEMIEKIFPLLKWAGYLNHQYDPKEGERPMAYIVICADTSICKRGYELDVGAAVENMILSAIEDGVGSCWVGSVDRTALKELLAIPEEYTISCVLALGYPDESPEETVITDGSIQYYLKDGTLNVPKRSLEDIIIKFV